MMGWSSLRSEDVEVAALPDQRVRVAIRDPRGHWITEVIERADVLDAARLWEDGAESHERAGAVMRLVAMRLRELPASDERPPSAKDAPGVVRD
jgi:hypothetical protein